MTTDEAKNNIGALVKLLLPTSNMIVNRQWDYNLPIGTIAKVNYYVSVLMTKEGAIVFGSKGGYLEFYVERFEFVIFNKNEIEKLIEQLEL